MYEALRPSTGAFIRWIDQFIDRPDSLSLVDLMGRRFWLAAWVFVPPLFAPAVVLYAYVGAVLPSLALSAWLLLAPVILKYGRHVSTVMLVHLTATVHLALFMYMGLATPPADVFSVAYMALVPLSVSLTLPTRHSLLWGAMSFVCAVLVATAKVTDFALGAPFDHQDELRLLLVLLYVPSAIALGYLFLVQRRLVADEASRLGRAQSAFLATMSHELRTPMNGVLGMTQLLLQSPLAVDQREQLQALRTSSEIMVTLLNDVLDFAKIESGKMLVESVPMSPANCVAESILLFQGMARERGLVLSFEPDASVPAMGCGDPTRLRQVLSNLIGNAVKFTLQGSVKVSMSWANDVLTIRVADTGIGIAPEALAKLFTPFHQLESSTTRRFGGSGLGLAISLRLVELMGGSLAVSSTPQVGSVFTATVRMPVSSAPVAGAGSLDTFNGAGRQVLVVDDNSINLAVARGLLTKLGFTVVTATNGMQAVARCEAGQFAAVFMDCHMPEMDGFAATRVLRGRPENEALPIIALTASAMKEDVDACYRAGMTDFLAKPLKREQLIEVLRRRLQ